MKQFLREVFLQCWPLGQTCAVDWDAWGVIAAGVIGAVTVGIAVLAWQTSRQAAKIAASQHRVAVDLRKGQARIIGRLLLHEVTALTAKVRHHEHVVETFFDVDGSPIQGWRSVRDALRALQRPLLPSAESMIEQLHNLPDWLGADLATMISHSRDISDAVQRIIESIHEHPPSSFSRGIGVYYSYSGQKRAFDNLLDQLRFVAKISPGFVAEFRGEVLGKTAAAEAARDVVG